MSTQPIEPTLVKRIQVTYDVNKGRKGYLPDIRTVDAKNVDVYTHTWMYDNKPQYELYLVWFSESVRPLVRYEAFVYSFDIITLKIDN